MGTWMMQVGSCLPPQRPAACSQPVDPGELFQHSEIRVVLGATKGKKVTPETLALKFIPDTRF